MSRFFRGSASAAQAARSTAQKERPPLGTGGAGASAGTSPTPGPGNASGSGRPPGTASAAGGARAPAGQKPASGKPSCGATDKKSETPPRPKIKMSLTPAHPAFWQEVGATVTCGLRLRPNFSLVGQWVLVLSALRIPHRLVRQGGDGFFLYVPVMHAQRAENELHAYLLEDLNKPKPRPLPKYENSQVCLGVLLALAVFFGLYTGWFKWHPLTPEDWVRLGGLDAIRVLFDHEWYRVITALTLHADSGHLFGNLFFGGLVAVALCRQMGAGLGWLLILLSGVLGNALITVLRGGPHVSIGASTALLGAMGVLCGFTFFTTDQQGWRRVVLPLAAALAWLAFLGSEGENTDLGAHFTGLLCGLPLGAGAGFLFKHKLFPTPEIDRILGLLALLLVVFAWFLAFTRL